MKKDKCAVFKIIAFLMEVGRCYLQDEANRFDPDEHYYNATE